MTDFLPWWEQHPGRLEHERSALQPLGVTVHEDSHARADGVIRWMLTVPDEHTGQGDVDLVVTFPEFYPFLRPDVTAPGLDMAHHQHPFGKNLCLIGRASASWDTHNDLAWLIREQLRKALTLGAADERGGDEENQGEPFSDYYNYTDNVMVLVDSAWQPPPSVSGGMATLRITGAMPLQPGTPNIFAFESIASAGAVAAFSMPSAITRYYQNYPEWPAQWLHLPAPVHTPDAEGLWATVEAIAGSHPYRRTCNGVEFELRLISFPEEHSATTTGTGWVLLIHQLGDWLPIKGKDRKSGNPARHTPRRALSTYHLIRSGRIGTTDMRARLGPASPLSSKRMLLIGAGAIGSVIADQLARVGIKGLTVIDYDVLEPGNLVRHANNLTLIGASKGAAAAALATQVNPYLEAESIVAVVGGTAGGAEQRVLLARAYDQADLVIDATAEVGVQRLTSSLARQIGKPWIGAQATNGARGGTVVRVPAAATWCFSCFEWARSQDERLQPEASPAPLTQPIGCAEPTFLGAGYDLNEVSLHTVRTAVAVLTDQPTYDAAILSLGQPGEPDLPRWETHTLTQHQDCRHG